MESTLSMNVPSSPCTQTNAMTTNTYRTNDNRLRHAASLKDAEAGEQSRSIPLLFSPSANREHMTKSFQASSLGLGIVVGALAQISTLAIISQLSSMLSYHTHALLFSSAAILIAMALAVLCLLRQLLTIVHEMGRRSSTKEDDLATDDTRDNDAAFQYLLLQMENRFVGGAVIGLCGAWIATGKL
jgi:hypothetical protein